jgi:carbon storage regulator
MLVLNRKLGEKIKIFDDIELVVLGIKGKNQIKLGFEAPKNISIHRLEVYERIQQKNLEPLNNKILD